MQNFDKLRSIIAATLGIDEDLITESLTMEDIPQWDSMGNMAIIAAVEEGFGIEFPLEDLFELNSVGAILDEISKLNNGL